jgi:hypothetical protein
MATERQIEANRRNALKSTGPKTEAGKEISRRNATTHGLSGLGIVLPEAEEAAVAERLASWSSKYGELQPHQTWALEELVRESVRIDRGNREELALRARTVERARTAWHDDRRVAAETLGRRLASRPSLVTLLLEMTPHGCAWKVERWDGLADVLHAGQDWDDRQRALAQDLLGVVAEFRDIPGVIDLEDADPLAVRTHRLAVIEAEINRLVELAETTLAPLDAMDREYTANGIEIEPDRALARLTRYLNACHRRFQAAERVLRSATPPTKRTQSDPEPQARPVAAPRPVAPPIPPLLAPTPVRIDSPCPARTLNRRQRRAIAKQERRAG